MPSEAYAHAGGLGLPLFREGRRTEDAQQSSKKNTTNTTSQKNQTKGTPVQIRTNEQSKDNRLPIDGKARRVNRALPADKVLNLLLTGSPDLYRLAEVVGNWIWIRFSEIPTAEMRQTLAQLGFHWNNTRQTWQHPCGTLVEERADYDPRKRYGSYFAAQQKSA